MTVGSMAFTTVNEDTFFMQGGISYGPAGPTTNQFYTLDLTQPTWTTVNPPWRARVYPESLNLIAKINKHSISVSPDKQNLTFWADYPGLVLNYTIATDTWTQVPTPSQLTFSSDLHSETDPRTGLVYNPCGYNNVSMGVYNPATQSFTPATSPNGFVNDRFYTFVWSEVRNSFIFFGNTPIRETNPFVEYSTASNKWTALPATGDTPRFRPYNGTKMLLFGGEPSNESSSGSLYILDVPNMIWSQATGLDPSLGRSAMACAISGDNFIVWGGIRFISGGTPQDAPGAMLIYNIHTGAWTDTFTRGTHFDPNTPNPEPPGKDGKEGDVGSSETKSNAAAIGGGVAGVLVVIALVAFFVIRRRRQTKEKSGNGQRSGDYHQQDQILPSMETSRDNPPSSSFPFDIYSHPKPEDQKSVGYPIPPQKYTAMQESRAELDGRSNSGAASPQLNHFIPPPPPPLLSSLSPQDHIQQLQHQIANRQEKLSTQSPNPQYNPSFNSEISFEEGFRSPRGPQGAGVPVRKNDGVSGNFELQQQINSLQAELNRLQAKLDS
ncbi:hypothetical protein EC957_003390 [Mortierella hygrophila]|uniref:Kelch repeat-containing protein n=1 Tax=Mortierella hygrophila TaxID=979708 RepID=A0A9P6F3T6_9FUNG|nr:hypothetical protein EC957_003390 [Mortierella hygrophila]